MREITRAAFVEMGAGDHQPDTSRHPAMHRTHTLDAIILVKGRVRLLLDELPELLVEQRPLSRTGGAVKRLPLDRRQPRRSDR